MFNVCIFVQFTGSNPFYNPSFVFGTDIKSAHDLTLTGFMPTASHWRTGNCIAKLRIDLCFHRLRFLILSNEFWLKKTPSDLMVWRIFLEFHQQLYISGTFFLIPQHRQLHGFSPIVTPGKYNAPRTDPRIFL